MKSEESWRFSGKYRSEGSWRSCGSWLNSSKSYVHAFVVKESEIAIDTKNPLVHYYEYLNGGFMKNPLKLFGIIVLIAFAGFSMASCVTATTIGGASGSHGIFSGNSNAKILNANAQEIASYLDILGLFDSGYDDYVAAVKKAEDAGKKITSVTKHYVFFLKTTAYAK